MPLFSNRDTMGKTRGEGGITMTILELLFFLNTEENLEEQNLAEELDRLALSGTESQAYAKYAAEHPNDPIGKIADAVAKYKANRPYMSWDWERIREVAEITIPLVDMIRELDPDAEVAAEVDGLLEKHLIIVADSGQYSEWGIGKEMSAKLNRIISGIDEISISPLRKEKFRMMFVFKDIRKIVE